MNDPLYAFYKQVRNQLRKFTPKSILNIATELLHKVSNGGAEELRKFPPWNILLIIRWTLEEADSLSHRRGSATLNDFYKMLDVLHRMIDVKALLPNNYERPELFIRQLKYQQFALQENYNLEALARQELLFSSLPDAHPFCREFIRSTGLKISDFLSIFIILIFLVMENKNIKIITASDFQLDGKYLEKANVHAVLSRLGKPIEKLHAWLNEDRFRRNSIHDQLLMQSPLIEYPLVAMNDGEYITIYPRLLLRSCESIVHRILRKSDPEKFGNQFGPVFEKYIHKCIEDAGIAFLSEDELNSKLPNDGKCVDFVFVENRTTILIDAKGMSVSAQGRMAHDTKNLLLSLKGPVKKAIKQAQDTARRLKQAPSAAAVPSIMEEVFFIVVTFDDLMLSSGQDFEDTFGHLISPELETEFGTPLSIPLSNIFFLSINEFELLLACVQTAKTTFTDAFKFAKKQDQDSATRKFSFHQHLEELCPGRHVLRLLKNAFDNLFNRIVNEVQERK